MKKEIDHISWTPDGEEEENLELSLNNEEIDNIIEEHEKGGKEESQEEINPESLEEVVSDEKPETKQDEIEEIPEEEIKKQKERLATEKLIERERKLRQERNEVRKEVERLKEENARLARMSQESQSLATDNYGAFLESQAKYLMDKKTIALKEDDYEQATQLEFELSKIASEVMRHQTVKASLERQKQVEPQKQDTAPFQNQGYAQQQNYQDYEEEYEENPINEEAAQWIHKNRWAIQDSPEYNHRMATDVANYATILRQNLESNNKAHLIGTRKYFDVIDSYVQRNYVSNQAPKFNKSGPSSAPVRRQAGSTTSKEHHHVELPDRLKKMASRFGMTEEEYKKEYLNELKELRKKG